MEDTSNQEQLIAALQSSWMANNQTFKLPCETTRLDALRSHWVKATAGFSPSAEKIESWWERIHDWHNQPHRAYHTLVHLEELLAFLDVLRIDPNNPNYRLFVLAIFFHDAVYDPRSATNEEDSASLFQSFFEDAGGTGHEELQTRVVHFILATKQHNGTDDPVLGLFLDMDMAVLAKDASAYEAYAGLIRQEYIYVDRPIYCEKRAEILETFLGEHSIYCTPLLKAALEDRARRNLRTEIDMLKQGVIPREL